MKRTRPSRPPVSMPSGLAGFRFPPEVILLALVAAARVVLPGPRRASRRVWHRGRRVTLCRWVQRFTPLLIDAARPVQHLAGGRWFVDETYVKVARVWPYVYRLAGPSVMCVSTRSACGCGVRDDQPQHRQPISSDRVSSKGSLNVRSGSVRNDQTDTCWIVIINDDRYAYTANSGSGTISSYRVKATGQVRLVEGKAAFLAITSEPVDLDLAGSYYLYLLLRAVAAVRVQDDGGLSPRGVVRGALPVADGASGLAVY